MHKQMRDNAPQRTSKDARDRAPFRIIPTYSEAVTGDGSAYCGDLKKGDVSKAPVSTTLKALGVGVFLRNRARKPA